MKILEFNKALNNLITAFFTFLLLTLNSLSYSEEAFKVIVLGPHGGPRENNMSGYLLGTKSSNNFVCLDAGSLLNGIFIANKKNSFHDIQVNVSSDLNFEGEILKNHIKCYLISHAHLDHVAGLVINSTNDTKKTIFGINSTIDFIRDHLFNWDIWPNFGSEGKKPSLNQYLYHRLNLEETIAIPNTEFTVEPFLLSHPDGYQSTAFLLEASGLYALYFGDTAPDALEQKNHMEKIWEKITPLIQQNKLRVIFLECSYEDNDKKELFGHLNPKYMMDEFHKLAKLVDPFYPQLALKNFKVIVTHIKESLLKGPTSKQLVKEELEKLNTLNIQFIFPEQGQRIEL